MTKQQAYSFSILRYVHDVVAGEFLNVGVVLHARTPQTLKVATRESLGRVGQAFPDINRPAFLYELRTVSEGIDELAKEVENGLTFDDRLDARGYALRVLPDDDSSLQWSPAGYGITSDVDRTMQRLIERYVTQYDTAAERRRTDSEIWRQVRRKLAERGVEVPFEERQVAGPLDSIVFQTAWKNGSWHAYEALSLDLADGNDIKDKARRWRGHLDAVAADNNETLRLHFLTGRPRNASLVPAYETAKKILEGAPYASEVVDEENADDLVDSIERAVRTRGA